MKNRLLWALAGCFLLFMPVYAGEVVNVSKDAPRDAVVRVINTRGEVLITGWDKHEVEINGELDDLAEELIFDVDGRDVYIEVKLPDKDVNWGDGSDLRIRIPEGSRLKFEGVSTDLIVEQIRGGSHLRTVSGDIEIRDVEERLSVNTVSGDVEVERATGRTQVSTISGEIELDISATDIKLDTVSGDVEARLGSFEELDTRSVSGDTEVEGKFATGGSINMSSVSGDVDLTLERPVNAEVYARAGISGDVYNDWNDERPKENFPNGHELKMTVGDGSGRISISTVTADIRLD